MEELAEILKAHLRWLSNKVGGVRADLRRANLMGADLSEAQGVCLTPEEARNH